MAIEETILMVAAEASADLHGAKVVRALRERRPDLKLFGIGGTAMRAEGFEASIGAEALAVAGLTEVLCALPRLALILRRLVTMARRRRPSVAVLIDMPDFNLRLARRLKALGIPVVYYISPQVWAWRQSRVRRISALVDTMLVILPFEEEFFAQHGVPVQFVGHPLVEELPAVADTHAARAQLGLGTPTGPLVAILPGSRRKEVTRHLATMLHGVARLQAKFPHIQALIPVASTISECWVNAAVQRTHLPTKIFRGQATEVLTAADVAVVCSGTATLQTALLARPMIVVYRVSWLTFQILKRLVKVAHIALVNLIAQRRLVPELVQKSFTAANVARELDRLLCDRHLRLQLQHEFSAIRQQLGRGKTAEEVANVVLRYLKPGPLLGQAMAPLAAADGVEKLQSNDGSPRSHV